MTVALDLPLQSGRNGSHLGELDPKSINITLNDPIVTGDSEAPWRLGRDLPGFIDINKAVRSSTRQLSNVPHLTQCSCTILILQQ